jgi:Tfp pilus assembly protein PilF
MRSKQQSAATRHSAVTAALCVGLSIPSGFLATGCGGRDASIDYSTTARDPRRNTERAQELNRRAVELLEAGEWQEAEATLRRALVADVTYGPAHNNLGKAFFHQGRLYVAAWEFQYAAKLMPDQPEPKNNLGLVLEAAGKLDEAVNVYDEAVDLESDNVQFLGNLARARLRRGDEGPEVKQLLQALILRETRPQWLQWAKEHLARLPE